jgi:hypothetical protein
VQDLIARAREPLHDAHVAGMEETATTQPCRIDERDGLDHQRVAFPLAHGICRDNLRRILAHDWAREIPLGVNVESVSIVREEIDASVDLFHALAEVLAERR